MTVGTVLNAAKSLLGNGPVAGESSSAGSSIQNSGWKPEDIDIERTEGDLGYDEADVKDEPVAETVDEDLTANPMETKEVADIEDSDYTERTLPENEETAKSFGFNDDFFKSVGTATSSESPLSLKNILETGATVANPVNYGNSGTDSSFSSGSPIAGASAIGSNETGSNIGLNVPIEQPVEAGETNAEETEEKPQSLLEQAENAFKDDKDIDDKELPFVKTEQAAEDVEDLVKSDLPDEKKEEILENANDNGEIKEGEIQEESKDVIATMKEYKDKAVDIASKIASIFGPPVSSSASSSISKGSGAPDTDIAIKQSSLSDAVSSLIESTKSSGSAPSNSANIAASNVKQNIATPNQSHSGSTSKAMPSIKANSTSNSASSSGVSSKGSVAQQFKDIVANGIKSGTTTGDSSFKEAISGGPVGSVKQQDVKLGKVQAAQQQNMPQGNSLLNKIHKEVAEDYKKWPERNGVHFKDKGAIAILTEDGKDIDVKLGTRRIKSLEELSSDKLGLIEEIL